MQGSINIMAFIFILTKDKAVKNMEYFRQPCFMIP